jgi:hypothetical protein
MTQSIEARTPAEGFFGSLQPSAINFPLQVQGIDGEHWILQSVTKGRLPTRPRKFKERVLG